MALENMRGDGGKAVHAIMLFQESNVVVCVVCHGGSEDVGGVEPLDARSLDTLSRAVWRSHRYSS